MGLLELPTLAPEQKRLWSEFLSKTGYSRESVISVSYYSKTFLTHNGGRYQMSDGGKIKHLAGPSPYAEDRAS